MYTKRKSSLARPDLTIPGPSIADIVHGYQAPGPSIAEITAPLKRAAKTVAVNTPGRGLHRGRRYYS